MLGGHNPSYDPQRVCLSSNVRVDVGGAHNVDYPSSGVAAVACSRVVVEAEVAEQYSRHSGNGDDERDADWRGELEAITESKLALG
ncbi:hypothetical protein HBI56_225930 [Parastagonospora nodorum]|nr:hypothetical protein HBH51_216970 [Parastagonospora nodorum]KAH3967368.1 hypothetical protein HBH52_186200 [Parastagonospora nodorum]KAH4013350.1 hypothetical protein HBI09_216610 [Parastagonospora nodorum]KAH4045240.1 hypothetical protein HBH49_207970 [Parastagonospora nodorum]KAH4062674.1 hypothetical protein HBH50_199770 [Parastagonospora nodorum]